MGAGRWSDIEQLGIPERQTWHMAFDLFPEIHQRHNRRLRTVIQRGGVGVKAERIGFPQCPGTPHFFKERLDFSAVIGSNGAADDFCRRIVPVNDVSGGKQIGDILLCTGQGNVRLVCDFPTENTAFAVARKKIDILTSRLQDQGRRRPKPR